MQGTFWQKWTFGHQDTFNKQENDVLKEVTSHAVTLKFSLFELV